MRAKPKKLKIGNIRKRLQSEAEHLWKRYCLERDKVCQLCGGSKVLQVHHLFSRGYKNIFIDVANGITLCSVCHTGVTFQDCHKEKLRRIVIAKDKDSYDRLYEQSLDRRPFLFWKDVNWLEQQRDVLNEGIKK
ncbi:MAG TPA: hypothetical protein DCL42_10405 [Deltaproteobacteria bacterium]|nr:hypothetical protein [Deltaproteobacteria bacterium]